VLALVEADAVVRLVQADLAEFFGSDQVEVEG
jgi:hypothetical protein